MADSSIHHTESFFARRAAAATLILATLATAVWLLAPASETTAQTTTAGERVSTTVQTCADPIAIVVGEPAPDGAEVVTATDALFALQAAVGLQTCALCVCDVNGSGVVTAADALLTLAIAVGQNISLNCPSCEGGPMGTTSTTCPSFAPPETGLNFGVTADSSGVDASAVATESAVGEHPADLYTSGGSGNHAPSAAGDNTLSVEDIDLGLATDDELDGISFGDYVSSPYTYHFSLADSERRTGLGGSGARAEYDNETYPGDIFTSVGGPDLGTNTLERDEIALGLHPHDLTSDPTDDLDALDFGAGDGPYFLTVAGDATGGADIFRSSGGATSLILSAASIGLADTDEVDALVVQDINNDGLFNGNDYILFSVSPASVGALGSAVRSESLFGEAAADIFVSLGDGTNELAVDEVSLGLELTDDIDALEIQSGALGIFCGCGDGILVAPEECEVFVPCLNPAAKCNIADCTCSIPVCEDGILTPPEQCEFPTPVCPPGQFCNGSDCMCYKPKLCGNGVVDLAEQCDPTAIPNGCLNPTDVCTPNCLCDEGPYCGDGMLDPGEQCDRAAGGCPQGEQCNQANCQCVPDTGEPLCPNGMLEGAEECEIGIPCQDDLTCNELRCTCTEFPCDPDGVKAPDENCDPLAVPNGCKFDGESCNTECECVLYTPRCGDGAFTPGSEECDVVTIGQSTAHVGCMEGELCNDETCMCELCYDGEPISVSGILVFGYIIPTCSLIDSGVDQGCDVEHWHGGGFGIDQETGTDFAFIPDPDPSGCGHGKKSEVPTASIDLGGDVTGNAACLFKAENVTCIFP
jgi:hypothetical protein